MHVLQGCHRQGNIKESQFLKVREWCNNSGTIFGCLFKSVKRKGNLLSFREKRCANRSILIWYLSEHAGTVISVGAFCSSFLLFTYLIGQWKLLRGSWKVRERFSVRWVATPYLFLHSMFLSWVNCFMEGNNAITLPLFLDLSVHAYSPCQGGSTAPYFYFLWRITWVLCDLLCIWIFRYFPSKF